VQHIADALNGVPAGGQLGKVSFDEFDPGHMIEVLTLAGDQAVKDADAMTAPHKLLGKM
jgi:hypothetical protein